MRNNKRLLSMILALVLCLSMLPVSAMALELPELDVLEDVVAAVEEEEVEENITESQVTEEKVSNETGETEVYINLNAPVLYGASRVSVTNTTGATGEDILEEARSWANAGATYWSASEPWPKCIAWRTGYTTDGQTSFDCCGFVSRVLNDAGFRGESIVANYDCVLRENYGAYFIDTTIAGLVNYGTDITAAVMKAKNGDYSELLPGDIIGWVGDANLGNHIIIYAGLNSSGQPTMIEFTGSGYYERVITSDYQNAFQSGARLADIVDPYNITTELDLRNALSKECESIYIRKDIILAHDLTIPYGVSVYIEDGAIMTVPVNITLNNNADGFCISDGKLVVAGTMVNNARDRIVQVNKQGTIVVNGSISGSEHSYVQISADSISDLDMLLNLQDKGYRCNFGVHADMTLTSDLTIEETTTLWIYEEATLTVPVGVTLTNNSGFFVGLYDEYGGLNIKGHLCNNGNIDIRACGELLVSGTLSGTGTANIDIDDVQDMSMVDSLMKAYVCSYGILTDLTLNRDLVIEENERMLFEDNATLTVPADVTLINNGTIQLGMEKHHSYSDGTEEITYAEGILKVEGTFTNNGSILCVKGEIEKVENGVLSQNGFVVVWVRDESDFQMLNWVQDVHYILEQDVVLTEDIVLTGQLSIDGGTTLTITNGAIVTNSGEMYVGMGDTSGTLLIAGSLVNNQLVLVGEMGEVIVDGELTGAGDVCYVDGSEDDESEIKLAEVTTADELREAVNSGYTSIWIVENIAINEDLHLTEEMGVKIKNNATLTVPKGVKLTNDGYMLIGDSKGTFDDNGELILEYEKGALNIEGELVNNGSIDVLEWGQLKISGEVSGSGLAWIIVDDPLDFEMYKTIPTEFECRLWVENDMSLVDDLFVDSNDVITIENEAVLTVPIGTVLGNNGIINIGVSYSYEVDGVTHWDHIGGTLYVQNKLVNNGEVNVARQGKLIVTGNATGEGAINHDIDEENESKAGDSDGDGIIETEDLVHLMKCIVNDDISGLSGNSGDVNEDGEVDILDVIRLIRMLAA